MNIGSLLTHNAQCRPPALGVVFEEQRLTFLEFNRRVNRAANVLIGLGLGRLRAIRLPSARRQPRAFVNYCESRAVRDRFHSGGT
jgi:non-ribosomal peptide synthetase component F